MKKSFQITGMTCSACSNHIEKAVSKLEGINKVVVNLLANRMDVDFEEDKLQEQDIIKVVENSRLWSKKTRNKKEKYSSCR